jgi:hypothetical protein
MVLAGNTNGLLNSPWGEFKTLRWYPCRLARRPFGRRPDDGPLVKKGFMTRHTSGISGWLASVLADKRTRIAHLFAEIAGLGSPATMKPAIFRRFLALLTQIASEKEKEIDFIDHIEAVELKHRFRRDHNQLEHADSAHLPEPDCAYEGTPAGRKGMWRALRCWISS